VNKKRKQEKESRDTTILEGHKDRVNFGQRFKDSNLGKSN
jgi:hypothetical protein